MIENKCTKCSLRPGAEQGFFEKGECLKKNIPKVHQRAGVRIGLSTRIRSPPPQRSDG